MLSCVRSTLWLAASGAQTAKRSDAAITITRERERLARSSLPSGRYMYGGVLFHPSIITRVPSDTSVNRSADLVRQAGCVHLFQLFVKHTDAILHPEDNALDARA